MQMLGVSSSRLLTASTQEWHVQPVLVPGALALRPAPSPGLRDGVASLGRSEVSAYVTTIRRGISRKAVKAAIKAAEAEYSDALGALRTAQTETRNCHVRTEVALDRCLQLRYWAAKGDVEWLLEPKRAE